LLLTLPGTVLRVCDSAKYDIQYHDAIIEKYALAANLTFVACGGTPTNMQVNSIHLTGSHPPTHSAVAHLPTPNPYPTACPSLGQDPVGTMKRKDGCLVTALRIDVNVEEAFLLKAYVCNETSLKVIAEVEAQMPSEVGTKYYLVYAEMSNQLGYVKAEYVDFPTPLSSSALLASDPVAPADTTTTSERTLRRKRPRRKEEEGDVYTEEGEGSDDQGSDTEDEEGDSDSVTEDGSAFSDS
jgi:hypothetical protein